MAAPVLASALLPRVRKAREDYLPTGILPLDRVLPGLPRGAITELTGPGSSGRTSFLYSAMATATSRSEYCALIDTRGSFDPLSATQAGVELARMVWVRCGGNAEHAFKATDLILHGGGFGLVGLDLAEVPPTVLNRVPISYWHRFRRAIGDTPTVFVVLAGKPQAKSCASCWIEFRRKEPLWTGNKPFRLLRGLVSEATLQKPGPPAVVSFAVNRSSPAIREAA